MTWLKGGENFKRKGGGRRKKWSWTEESRRGFKEKIERVWQDKGEGGGGLGGDKGGYSSDIAGGAGGDGEERRRLVG